MKLLTIIYDASIEQSMIELLDGLEIRGITWVHEVHGRGGRGTKTNTPVFPGVNHLAFVAVPAADVPRIQRAIRRLQAGYRLKPGVTILCQDVEELP